MTDATHAPIDASRPWIVDPSDDPKAMNWVQSLFNPFGETSRLHFTRAWTGLFFTRLIYAVGTFLIVAIFGAAGAENPSGFIPPKGTWHLIIIVTALCSLVLHVRRLASAQRSPLWAGLVILPVLIGAGAFLGGASQGASQYQIAVKAAELHDQGLSDREIALQLGLIKDKPKEAPAEGADTPETNASGEAAGASPGRGNGARNGRGGQASNLLPKIDITEVSQREHAWSSGLGLAQMAWAPFSFLVMLWSLLWVGRLPNGGGTIRQRLEYEPTSYVEPAMMDNH